MSDKKIAAKLGFPTQTTAKHQLSGVAGGFCCQSLHRPQIFKDLWAMQVRDMR
jgi:hypothetical protein